MILYVDGFKISDGKVYDEKKSLRSEKCIFRFTISELETVHRVPNSNPALVIDHCCQVVSISRADGSIRRVLQVISLLPGARPGIDQC